MILPSIHTLQHKVFRPAVLYQVLNKQVPVQVPVVQVPVPVPVPNLQVPVPVQVLCINYRHSVTLQLHKVKVVVSFIFKKRTVRTNELQIQISHNCNFFGFGWLAATPAASQQHNKFFLATSTVLQVPVPVLKIQVPVQVQVLCMQVQVPLVPVPVLENVLKYNLSTSTSTKYNKTADQRRLVDAVPTTVRLKKVCILR